MNSTWHNKITTPIPADVDPQAIVSILQDHGYILKLNQLVTHYEKIPNAADTPPQRISYNVTEAIPIIPSLWKRSVTFTAQFEDHPDGIETFVQAPMGVNMHAKYTVKQAGEGSEGDAGAQMGISSTTGGWVLEESIDSSCSVVLKGFVEKTMLDSHKKQHQRFIERAREGRRGGGGDGEAVSGGDI